MAGHKSGWRGTIQERMWRFLIEEPNTGCWIWLGSRQRLGYGMVRVSGKMRLAHRVMYELVRGPIPEGLTLDHLCRQRACINPAHLQAVTHRENVLRGSSPIAEGARRTLCLYGHPLDGIQHGRARICLTCKRERGKLAMRVKRAKLRES